MSDELERYLRTLGDRAIGAGLPVRTIGSNWLPLAPLAKGSHVSLSAARHQIQVNLNNEDDADRVRFEALHAARLEIESQVGEGLVWEKKEGRRKTAVRATMDAGYADDDWTAQHDWAVATMVAFQRTFGERLR